MRLTLSVGSCDAHCHLFGPSGVFPFAPDSPFAPPEAPKEELFALHDRLGFDRAVVVQSTGHGTDHAGLLDALATAPERLRGVALLAPGASAADLDELDRAGVCGVRLNFMPHLGAAPSPEEIQATVRRIAGRGWHLEVHVAGDGLLRWAALLADIAPDPATLRRLLVTNPESLFGFAPVSAPQEVR